MYLRLAKETYDANDESDNDGDGDKNVRSHIQNTIKLFVKYSLNM